MNYSLLSQKLEADEQLLREAADEAEGQPLEAGAYTRALFSST